jgi:hypothetical protein
MDVFLRCLGHPFASSLDEDFRITPSIKGAPRGLHKSAHPFTIFWGHRATRNRSMMSTIGVVTLPRGSAKLGIYTKEHCPPHATCRELAGQWTVRIFFSFADASVGLLSVHPSPQMPTARVVNHLATAVQRNISECRRKWWEYQQNNPAMQAEGPCCLNNTTVAGETVVAAAYDPGTSRTTIRFLDGTIVVRTV